MTIRQYEVILYSNQGFTKGAKVHSVSPSGAIEEFIRVGLEAQLISTGRYEAKVVCEQVNGKQSVLTFPVIIG